MMVVAPSLWKPGISPLGGGDYQTVHSGHDAEKKILLTLGAVKKCST